MGSVQIQLLTTILIVLGYTQLTVGVSHHRKLLRRDVSAESPTVTVPSYNFTMPIDHFNTDDTRTYYNRYWMNNTYYRAGGPVFFFDFGESGVQEDAAATYLAETSGPTAMMQLAQHYNGLVIGWEHRYYGRSQPFPETIIDDESLVNGTSETWQYLTQEQSLEDVVYFASNFAPQGYSEDEATALRPSQTPWIWIGGSYPGSRGAWLRIRNPEIIYAVWSSSAPVQASIDGSSYYTPIADSLPSNCSTDVTAVIRYVDQILSGRYGETAYTQLQDLAYVTAETTGEDGFNVTLNLSNAREYDEAGIGRLLKQPLVSYFQYWGPSSTTHAFCDYLQSYDPMAYKTTPDDEIATLLTVLQNPGGMQFSGEGIAKNYGINAAVQAYMYALRTQLASFPTDDDSSSAFDNQAWTYQYLTEFGWLQGSSPGHINILSKFDNYTYEQEADTLDYFGADPSIIPAEPDVNHTLIKYGGWEMSPSNVMFTNGEYDPWRTFSVMSQEQDLGAPERNIVQVVPRCNQAPQGTDVFGLLYPGQVHVSDFNPSSEDEDSSTSPYVAGLNLFSQALDNWLPCFQAR